MKVLVTGGTGVVGQAAVDALLARGHQVRLFSRHADDDAPQWPEGIEAWPGSIDDAASVEGSADGCDAVVHCAGIVDETPPDITFESVNVEGTRHVVREAERAGVDRLVHVSSLGADRGESPYHRSKLAAEGIVRGFTRSWTILRPGNVYGPGDEVVSLLLKMVRTLPVIPTIDAGDQAFEPVWAGDLGEAIATAVERDDLRGETLEIAGPERTSMSDLIARLSEITGRSPLRLPVPGFLASFGARLASAVGIDVPVNESQLTMLREENIVRSPGGNALDGVLGVTPTPLDAGLRKLADSLQETLPEDGVGAAKRKRFWADIEGGRFTPEALLDRFRQRFSELTPWHVGVGAEPGTDTVPDEGETLTMSLPLRGNIQVRVEEVNPRSMTFVTLEGHPLAGAVRFLSEQRGDLVRFEVQVFDRAANFVDWVTMSTVGAVLQNQTWKETVENVVQESGGRAPEGVQQESVTLDADELERINAWLDDLVTSRRRAEREETLQPQRAAAREEGGEARM